MSESFSIGIVCFPSLGGSGVVASDLALGLAARGHHVHLVARSRPMRAIPSCDRLHFHEVHVPDYPVFEHAPYALALASKLAEVGQKHRLDLIQVHYAVPHAVSAHLAREMLGKLAPRVVVSLHGTDVTHLGADPAYRQVTAFAVERAHGVTVPSAFLRREAMERLGLSSETNIEVLPNFVDTERFSPPPRRDRGVLDAVFRAAGKPVVDGPVLFHVSNFRAVKRVGDLLQVIALVKGKLPVRLVLVGDGPERSQAETQAHELGIADTVCFLGSQDDFVDDLRHADAFLLTSEVESFGIAGLEALSAGVPVLGYAVGGVPEVVVEGTGKLVPPLDVEALANAVVEFVAEPERAEAMRAAAREHAVSRFRREPALDRFEAYFQRTLASDGDGGVAGIVAASSDSTETRERESPESESTGSESRGIESTRIESDDGGAKSTESTRGESASLNDSLDMDRAEPVTNVRLAPVGVGAFGSDVGNDCANDAPDDVGSNGQNGGRGAVAVGLREGGRFKRG